VDENSEKEIRPRDRRVGVLHMMPSVSNWGAIGDGSHVSSRDTTWYIFPSAISPYDDA